MDESLRTSDALARCGEWVGALVCLPSYVSGDGAPYRPVALVLVEPESGLIVGNGIVKADEVLERAADLFRDAAADPLIGEPRTPRRLRVGTPELANALRGRIGDVDLVMAPTPEADEVTAALLERMTASQDDDEEGLTYVGPDMTASDVARFFTASAKLYRRKPWDCVPSDGFMTIACDRLGIKDGALCVVGQGGEAFGFALFRSVGDAVAYIDASARRGAGEEAAFPEHLMLSYDDRATIGDVLAREIESHGWVLAGPRAYPSVVVVDRDVVTRGLTRDELDAMTAIASGLADFAADDRLASAWDTGEAATWERQADGVDVKLGAPLWLPLDDADEDDDDVLRRRCADLLDRFASSPEAAPEHLGWADLLASYSLDYLGSSLDALSPAELDELLYEIVPRKVSCEPDQAPAIVAAVRAILAFAARDLDSGTARRSLAALRPDASQKLARLLADPRNFGMAKSVVMSATRAGFEASDAGLAAFLITTGGRLPSLAAPRDQPPQRERKQPAKDKRVKRKAARRARKSSRKH